MTDEFENLILEHLRAMRASLAKLEENDTFLKARMWSLELQMARLRSDLAGFRCDMTAMDSIDKRFDRIECKHAATSAPGNGAAGGRTRHIDPVLSELGEIKAQLNQKAQYSVEKIFEQLRHSSAQHSKDNL